MRANHWHRFLFLVVLASFSCPPAVAITLPENPPPLPTDPEQWINSSPLSYDQIAGKGVVFWYFEETCPKCRRMWPKLLEDVAQFADKPVLFVAVNSGCEREEIVKYAEKQNISWPILVDPDRSFEAASGDVAISLQAITEVRMVMPDRKYMWGWWNDIPQTVEWATKGASWKFNYEKVPPEMHLAARRLEFGDFLPAAAAIKSGLESDTKSVRSTATYMQGYIQKLMQQDFENRLTATNANDPWLRYAALTSVAEQFAPHALPPKQKTELEKLGTNPAVINEQKSRKAMVAIQAKRETMNPATKRARLERIIKAYPETHAAKEAKELLAQIEGELET